MNKNLKNSLLQIWKRNLKSQKRSIR